jgi:hypothetical protein
LRPKEREEETNGKEYRLKVEDASHTVSQPCLAWACIRLDRLQQGYRFIRLYSRKGCEVNGGKLLVKIEKVLR